MSRKMPTNLSEMNSQNSHSHNHRYKKKFGNSFSGFEDLKSHKLMAGLTASALKIISGRL
jgi:hypothetical protein